MIVDRKKFLCYFKTRKRKVRCANEVLIYLLKTIITEQRVIMLSGIDYLFPGQSTTNVDRMRISCENKRQNEKQHL